MTGLPDFPSASLHGQPKPLEIRHRHRQVELIRIVRRRLSLGPPMPLDGLGRDRGGDRLQEGTPEAPRTCTLNGCPYAALLVEKVVEVALLDPEVLQRVNVSRPFARAFARRMPLIPPADVPERMSTTNRVLDTGPRSTSSRGFQYVSAHLVGARSRGRQPLSAERSSSGTARPLQSALGAVERTSRKSSCAMPLM